eukprot:431541-Pleurochrysis_carterae.AAC.1
MPLSGPCLLYPLPTASLPLLPRHQQNSLFQCIEVAGTVRIRLQVRVTVHVRVYFELEQEFALGLSQDKRQHSKYPACAGRVPERRRFGGFRHVDARARTEAV